MHLLVFGGQICQAEIVVAGAALSPGSRRKSLLTLVTLLMVVPVSAAVEIGGVEGHFRAGFSLKL